MSSKYALRALCYIAAHPDDVPITGADLAERTGVPANYLDKILQSLRNRDILSASRGTGGGYWLKDKPDKIALIDVVTVFERIEASPFCLLWVDEPCSGENPCSAHPAWAEIHNRFTGFLRDTTIENIAYNKSGKKTLAQD